MTTGSSERWRRIEDLCEQALALDSRERHHFLAEACGADEALRREVESLLANATKAEDFLAPSDLAAAAAQVVGGPQSATLMIGRRIGSYEIGRRLGAGGMGEVYRARDTKLGRDVAIKLLPPAFTADRERLARFEREARVLASLNHPNIAAIYGVEAFGDVQALILELVEGDTLADRIARSGRDRAPSISLPIPEALAIARQIADGLEAAHAKGIVHRDLKPANIKVTPAGTVKVLDFGLAKSSVGSAPDLSHSPTITLGGTRDGVLLGTAAYMSPEQARGQAVDKRADIWAFGCVLFEMLAGRMAFPGATVSDHIAAILERDPEWSALPASTPSIVQRLLRRCLEKDSIRRLHDIADARIEIDDALTLPIVAAPAPSPRRFDRLAWSVGAVVLAALSAWTAWRIADSRHPLPPRPVTRFVIQPPAVGSFNGSFQGGGYAISPGGSELAYEAGPGNKQQLMLRRLDEFEATPIAGTEGGAAPFFSPDGQWLGFFAGGKLLKVSVRGGAAPITLCAGIDMGGLNGATWLGDDTVIFTGRERPLHRVSAEGGEPQPLSTIDRAAHEIDHHSPEVLPGGHAMLFAIHRSEDRFSIAVQSFESGQRKVVIESGFSPRYLPSGHIVFARGTAILAAPFDQNRLEVTGQPVTLVEHVATRARDGFGAFQLAGSGTLVFESEASTEGRVLVWVDRSGAEMPLAIPPRAFRTPRVSPDGKTVAFAAGNGDRHDIWTYDLTTGTPTRLTSEGDNEAPLWTPDGRRLTYSSRRGGVQHLMWQPADGSGLAEFLTTSTSLLWPNAWTVDNKALIYTEQPPTDLSRMFVLHLDGERGSEPLTAYNRGGSRQASLLADGRWLAFTAADPGPVQVYTGTLPPSGARHQVTVDGGREPKWSRNGRELFYRFRTRVYAVPVDTTRGFSAGKPVVLFEGPYVVGGGNPGGLDYDVAPDGRFLMIKPTEEERAPPRLNIVLNWIDEVARRVPSRVRR